MKSIFKIDKSKWGNVKLCDIAERMMRKNVNNETNIPLTISSSLGLINQNNFFNKTIASHNLTNYYLLYKNDFAYNKSYSKGFEYGSIKRLTRYNKGALSTLYICFTLKKGVNIDFFEIYFNSLVWYKEIADKCTEGARNHGLLNVSADDFLNIKMHIPISIDEQKYVVKFFSQLSRRIELQKNKIESLKKIYNCQLNNLFTNKSRIKRVSLGCLTEQIKSKCKNRNLEVYSVNNIDGFVPQKTQFGGRGEVASTDRSNYSIVKKGQFAYNPSRINVGSISYLKVNKEVIVSPLYIIFQCSNAINNDYLEYYFHSIDFEKQRRKLAAGSVRSNLTYDNFCKISIPLPSLKIQSKIAELFISFHNKINAEQLVLDSYIKLERQFLIDYFDR